MGVAVSKWNAMDPISSIPDRFLGSLTALQSQVISSSITSRINLGRKALTTERMFQFERLNADIVLEVFQFYVASQPDGVFVLTLVSKSWCQFVLQSPVLWRWVAVEDRSPDWEEKLSLSASIATSPLQIVLRIPLADWSPLKPVIGRCQDLYIEIPEYMSGRDVTEETRALLASPEFPETCGVHWYCAGEELTREDRKPLSNPMPNVTRLVLSADGSEHPNYHRYAATRDIRYFEQGDEYHPLVLLKTFRLLEVLRNTISLHTLILHHPSMDPIFSDIDLPLVTLPVLDDLQIVDIDFDRNGSLVPFLESMKLPLLSSLTLSGDYADMMVLGGYLATAARPTILTLRVNSCRSFTSPEIVSGFNIRSITSFHLHVYILKFGESEEMGLISHIKDLVESFQMLSEVDLCLPPDWYEDDDSLELFT